MLSSLFEAKRLIEKQVTCFGAKIIVLHKLN